MNAHPLRYRPWLGILLIALSLLAEFLLPVPHYFTGMIFFAVLVGMVFWSQYGPVREGG